MRKLIQALYHIPCINCGREREKIRFVLCESCTELLTLEEGAFSPIKWCDRCFVCFSIEGPIKSLFSHYIQHPSSKLKKALSAFIYMKLLKENISNVTYVTTPISNAFCREGKREKQIAMYLASMLQAEYKPLLKIASQAQIKCLLVFSSCTKKAEQLEQYFFQMKNRCIQSVIIITLY